jgi:hypothetical protein
LGLANFVVIACLEQVKTAYGLGGSFGFELFIAVVSWAVCIGGWIIISVLGPVIADNRPRMELDALDIDSQI